MKFKIIKDNKNTYIPAVMLEDKRLTAGAKGLMACIISYAEYEPQYLYDMFGKTCSSESETTSLIEELIKFGYLEDVM